MKKLIIITLLFAAISAQGQDYILKAGDRFPDITLHPMVNAPFKDLHLNTYNSKKYIILNLWGTWCGPCIPEMDVLAKLQDKYPQQIQVIGYSNDPEEKLKKYITKKPSKVWLASDTSFLLYRMLCITSVGHAVLLDPQHNIVAVVKSDSVNEKLITRLIKGEKIKSNAETAEANNSEKDPFGVDSLQTSSFTIRSYMKGQQAMGRAPIKGVFAYRRRSYYNASLINMYKDAYGVSSDKQVVYDFDRKKYADYSDKNQQYCMDLLVAPEQKDSLLAIMQRKLNESLPVKGRTEIRTIPVYVLKQKSGSAVNISVSAESAISYKFSGNGFEGTGVKLDDFAGIYLSNELELPVINETGLTQRYDIKTANDMRDKENILAGIDKLGLTLEKTERPVKVLVLYAQPIVGYIMGTYK